MSNTELKKRLVKTMSSDPAAVKTVEMKEAVATSGGKLERSYTTIGVSSDQSLLSKVTSQIQNIVTMAIFTIKFCLSWPVKHIA